jgi:hypothetical protein
MNEHRTSSSSVISAPLQRPNGIGISRAQGMLTNRDDNHAEYRSLTGARVGVGWMPRLGANEFV